MKKQQIIKSLQNIGLSETDAKVYIGALQLGPTTALKIARISDLKRSTVYLALDSLEKYGLIGVAHQGLKRYFVAEDPKILDNIIKSKYQSLGQILPELNKLHAFKGFDATIKTYHGHEAVKSAYNELIDNLKPKTTYCAISNPDEWLQLDEIFFQKFREKRAKLSLRTQLLLVDTPLAKKIKQFDKNYNHTTKLLPTSLKINSSVTITEGLVMIHQLTEPTNAIVIKNPNTVQFHHELFQLVWHILQN